MDLTIDKGAVRGVDRDGVLNDYGRQGFYVHLNGLTLHFEDEADAEELARMIARRQGMPFAS